MSKKDVINELQHYLELYAIQGNEEYLIGIIIYSSMLVGMES